MALLLAGASGAASVDLDEETPWSEESFELPASSIPDRPIFIDLGQGTENTFAVDARTLTVGRDGVVRFILRVVSPDGATTTTFEGLRCDTQEWRRYATGRADGTWTRARERVENWRRIRATSINSYGSVLMREFFCPGGIGVRNAAEAISALERGGHPALRMKP